MARPIRGRRLTTPRRLIQGSSETGAAHPALPAVVLLVFFAVFMAAIAPLNFSSILRKLFPSPLQTVPHQNAAVWVDNNAGVYYCADSIMFGKSKGEYMKQVDALDRGYQPALGTYCSGPAWHLRSQAVPTANSNAPVLPPNPLAPTVKNPIENPKPKFETPGSTPPSLSITH